MKIGIIAYENCTTSMIMGVMDILALANLQAPTKSKPLFEVMIVTKTGDQVNSFTRYPIIPSASIRSKNDFDIIYVPGFLADALGTLSREKDIITWLSVQHKKGVRLAAACNGNLFLAESGVLDGKMATTHWSLKGLFQKRYPAVHLKAEKIIVDEGDVVSAAGVTAYLNLAIHLVAKYASDEIASYCSKIFLVDSGRRIQTPYLIFSTPKNHGDTEIVKVQNWIEEHYQTAMKADSIMNAASLSRRTLIRRFKSATGDTPMEYLQRVRIENAKRFLEISDKTFSEITWEVGYNDISSFQRLFKIHTRLTPKEYRRKFSLVVSNA